MKPNDKAIEALLAERDTVRKELIDEIKRLDRERIAWKKQQEETAALLKQVEAERDALKATVNAQHKALCSNAARLAPVEDEARHLTTDEQKVFHSALRRSAKIKKPVKDIKLSQIGSEAIYKMKLEVAIDKETSEEPCGELGDPWSYISESDAIIDAVRPHIEAAERERCAKRILETNWVDADPEEIAAAIRSGK